MNEFTGMSLQVLRLRQGLKAKEVASKLGISPSYYSEIERGRKPFPTDGEFIRSLAKALDFSETMFRGVVGFHEQVGKPMSAKEKANTKQFINQKGPELLIQSLASIERDHEKPGASQADREDRDAVWDGIKNDWPRIRQAVEQAEEAEEAKILKETDAAFSKRLADLERAAKYYFLDASEVFEMAKERSSESGPEKAAADALLRIMAESLGKMQPWIEQGLSQLLNDSRTLRRIAKSKE